MKKVLGLDLGTASIGWAMVNSADNSDEKSEILGCGSRVIPISAEEKDSFEKGKSITTNANRTLKRSMRRTLQRRKQRRDRLLQLLMEESWIQPGEILSEKGKGSTYETLRLRAQAAQSEISLSELARVLLSINNKRGYKSSRKLDFAEEGKLIDGMSIAKQLAESGQTPAQYALEISQNGKYTQLEFYRSDLEAERDRVWMVQQNYHPDILTDDFKRKVEHLSKAGTSKEFLKRYGVYTADNKGKDKKKVSLEWRVKALSENLEIEVLAYVISDLQGEIQGASGYLGSISDRSKELFFRSETVGQYLYRNLKEQPGYSTRNKVFYRQDYIKEFWRIWSVQSQYHPELSTELAKKIADTILFYQRPLKSQKALIAFCEFESHPIQVVIDGKTKMRTSGSRVAPKSSLLFQEFKIWQILNQLSVTDRTVDETFGLSQEQKEHLALLLSVREKLSATEVLKYLQLSPRRYELNYKEIEGNKTFSKIYEKLFAIVRESGHGEYELNKLSYEDAVRVLREVLPVLGCSVDVFSFDSSLPKEEYEQQTVFKLWHLLYSYEGDNSPTGEVALVRRIEQLTGLEEPWAKMLAGVHFQDDYASLSHKAMTKILPYLKRGDLYSEACAKAGYNHSHSLTREERDSRTLVSRLEQIPKGALRNPVVEKVINQMINVVNAADAAYGKPDEVHIELARDLKMSAKEREKATNGIQENNKRNASITKILQEEFHIASVRKSDILRYRLYEELKENGYKTLYSNRYIPKSAIFSKDIDIEHIIPQALMFDDSFANKTLEYNDVNIEKGRRTALSYVEDKYSEDEVMQFRLRVDDLCKRGSISPKKKQYLLMREKDIPDGFVERDLRNSQYIAKKAREILESYVHLVMPTTGSVTARLREDWQLVDIMKEINLTKYQRADRTYEETCLDGRTVLKIKDWSKREDHRHHAMDAITIAFTQPRHIHILNNLRAKLGSEDFQDFFRENTTDTGKKRIFTPPMPLNELRKEVRTHLGAALVSIKTKNKVVTKNINKIQTANGVLRQEELTPRGALHKETVYGQRKVYEVFYLPVNAKMTEEVLMNVASAAERRALKERLDAYGGDAKKAFAGKNSPKNTPIFVDAARQVIVPEKVKCVRFKYVYSIRKNVAPDLSIDKILDKCAKAKIEERVREFGGDVKAALSNLDINPIWLDDAKTIPIKRVTITENFDLVALHNKKDKNGQLITDLENAPQPCDFVNLRNNHHIALYKDADGQIQERLVSLFDALQRVNMHLPVVDKQHYADLGWTFLYSMKINEMFVFPEPENGFFPDELDLLDPANAAIISPHLFRVQKLSSKDYCFRHHLETSVRNEEKELRDITWKRVTSIQSMEKVVKVRINHLGRIVAVGEYD